MNLRLHTVILIPVVVVIVLGIGALSVYSFLGTRNSLSSDVVPELVSATAGEASGLVETRLAAGIESSGLLAEDPTLEEWFRRGEEDPGLRNLIQERLNRLADRPEYVTAFAASTRSKRYWSNGSAGAEAVTRDDPDDIWFFRAAEMEGEYLLDLRYDQELRDRFLYAYAPIELEGERVGIVGVSMDVSMAIPEDAAIPGGDVFLAGADGMILAGSNPENEGQYVQTYLPDFDLGEQAAAAGGSPVVQTERALLDADETRLPVFTTSEQVLDSEYRVVATVPASLLADTVSNIRRSALLGGLVVVVIAALLLRFLILRSVRGVIQVTHELGEISTGEADLSRRLEVRGSREVAQLASCFNDFVASLGGLVGSVRQDADSLSREQESIVGSATETAASVNEITSNISSVSTSVDRLHESIGKAEEQVDQITESIARMESDIDTNVSAIEQTSSSAEEINAQSQSIKTTAGRNAEEVQALSDAVSRSSSVLEGLNERVSRLAEQTDEMLTATSVIDAVSAQTNLLSMNAAIEAAHAGEAGKGFSVVAEEIRKLAENSSKNSKVIRDSLRGAVDLIQEINESTEGMRTTFSTVMSTTSTTHDAFTEIDATVSELSAGMTEVTNAIVAIRDAIISIDGQSKEVRRFADEIVSRNRENSAIGTEVQGAIAEISSGSEQINGSVNKLNESLHTLGEHVKGLYGKMQRFRIQ